MTISPGLRAAVLSLSSVILLTSACSGGKAEPKQGKDQQQQQQRPVPVAVAPVEQKPMPLTVQAIGTVEALSTVSVRAQVGGELVRVHVKEGQDVKKGDLLFTIDPRTFEATLAQAQANLAKDQGQVQQARAVLERDMARVNQSRAALARDEAQAKNADVQERRYRELLTKELISREQYDQIKTTAESMAATLASDRADITSAEETVRVDQAAVKSAEQVVRADAAAVDNTKIQLSFTAIRSPIDGRTGSLMLHEGNVVRAGGTSDSTLLVINQITPIYVTFTVPQQLLPEVKRYMAQGKLAVDAIPSGEQRPVSGVVTFVDNAVDVTTGTIKMKATFGNEERRLWPGQFVNASLTLAIEPDAIVIPAAAIQTGQRGAYVFVVKPDATVDVRPVVVARTQGNDTIIKSGLKAGESVVTDGQPRLVAGSKVEIRTATGAGVGARPQASGPSGSPPQLGGGPTPPPGARPQGAQPPQMGERAPTAANPQPQGAPPAQRRP
jgi:membrane fusion protein, multidrug efflux system